MQTGLPARFQVRVQVQALVNALRRPTSDRMKLLRLAGEALSALDRCGLPGDESLRAQVKELRAALQAGGPVDVADYAAELGRAASRINWSPASERLSARTPVAV